MISGSLIFSTEKSVGMKTFSHFMSLWSRIRWAGGSRRMGPRVASDKPADRVRWARLSGRMGRVGSLQMQWARGSGGIGWARGSRQMVPRLASDGPAGGIGWAGGLSGRMGRVGSLQMQWARASGRVGWARASRLKGVTNCDLSWQESHVF